jgi:hypothetical protein
MAPNCRWAPGPVVFAVLGTPADESGRRRGARKAVSCRFSADASNVRTPGAQDGGIVCDITFEMIAKSMFNSNIAFVCNTLAKSLFANRKAVDRRDFFPYSAVKWGKVG